MSEMMRQCMNWLMSLGWAGMILGVFLLAALEFLAALGMARLAGGPRP